MNDAQKRVLAEAEFYFYYAGWPELFEVPTTNSSIWLPEVGTRELLQFNAKVRQHLRSGSLALRPQSAIKPIVTIT